jgi:hypothetical protein
MNTVFRGCSNLKYAPVIPNNVTDMSGTFYDCSALINEGLSAIPDSVTNMGNCFSGCSSLVKAPAISNNVTTISGMFQNCTSLTDLSDFQIPTNVKSLDSLFNGCSSLKDASHLIMPSKEAVSLLTMRYTFYNCTSLEKAPSEIQSNAMYIPSLFQNCTSLTGTIMVNGGGKDHSNCFAGTEQQIIIIATNKTDSSMEAIAATSTNGNVIYQK